MIGNFGPCVEFTLAPENDGQPFHVPLHGPSSATTWGITRQTLSRWRRKSVTLEEMRFLTREEAREIYKAWFWKTISGDILPLGVDLLVFDHGVIVGENASARLLQGALFVPYDEHIGETTILAILAIPRAALLSRLRERQERHYRSFKEFSIYKHGWLSRLNRRYMAAMNMAGLAGKRTNGHH